MGESRDTEGKRDCGLLFPLSTKAVLNHQGARATVACPSRFSQGSLCCYCSLNVSPESLILQRSKSVIRPFSRSAQGLSCVLELGNLRPTLNVQKEFEYRLADRPCLILAISTTMTSRDTTTRAHAARNSESSNQITQIRSSRLFSDPNR